jgi:hypothetical protein
MTSLMNIYLRFQLFIIITLFLSCHTLTNEKIYKDEPFSNSPAIKKEICLLFQRPKDSKMGKDSNLTINRTINLLKELENEMIHVSNYDISHKDSTFFTKTLKLECEKKYILIFMLTRENTIDDLKPEDIQLFSDFNYQRFIDQGKRI